MDPIAITVYGKPNCQQCWATTTKLDKLELEYTYVDITEDQDAYDYVIGLGYAQAPVVALSNDTHWSGYRPGKLAQIKEGV